MSHTLVIQSHRNPLPYPWIRSCLDSVRLWSETNGFDYRFIGEELFDDIPSALRTKTRQHVVIATDLARLYAIRNALENAYDAVIWMDADFLVFSPEGFQITTQSYLIGREVWIQKDKQQRLKVYKKVHNAFLLFRKDNSFLDFYIETAERLLELNQAGMPPQFIGPKLLTALHNVSILPVQESAGMLSPLVLKDIVNSGGRALDLFVENSPQKIEGANLCTSSCVNKELSEQDMEVAIERLLDTASASTLFQ